MSQPNQETTPKNTPPVNPDAALLVGGPGGDHGKTMPTHGSTHPELASNPTTQNTPPAQGTEVTLNGKKFKSAQEMSEYVANLEKKVTLNQPPQQTIAQANQTPKVQATPGKKSYTELLFEDPEQAVASIKQDIKAEFDIQRQQEENRKSFWSQFYVENPDLRGKEEIIDGMVAKNWGSLSLLTVADFGKKVADDSRVMLKKAGLMNATEIPNNPSAALSSGGQTPSGQQAIPAKETSFVDEMNNYKGKNHKVK